MNQEQEIQQKKILTDAHTLYEKALNSHAFFKVHDHATGEDLVQDTFLKTWKYLVKGGEIVLMKSFLYHVLNNLIVDQYRKHKTTSLDVLIEAGFEPSIDDSEHVCNVLDGKAAFLLIKHLPKKYQKVMSMRYMQHLSLEEISHVTKQSKNAVAVEVHRGLLKLRLIMQPCAEDSKKTKLKPVTLVCSARKLPLRPRILLKIKKKVHHPLS